MPRTTRVLLALALLAPLSAEAYVFIGPRWPVTSFPIPWELDFDGSRDVSTSADREAVMNAFTAWGAVGQTRASVRTPTDLAAAQQVAGGDGKNRVFWVECARGGTCWRYGEYTLGVTTPQYYTTGEMFDADIVFNGRDYVWTVGDAANSAYCRGGCTDTFSIAVHEQGHFFGLDHPCAPTATGTNCRTSAEANAVMFAAYPGYPKQALNSDDIAGIRALYPAATAGSGLQGSGCTQSSDCAQSPRALICAQSARSSICTQACSGPSDTSCPANYACQAKTGGGYACLFASDAPGDLCKACASGSDCSNGRCIQLETFSYCSRACDQTGCPDGYQCAAFQGSSETFCYPSSESCAGNCVSGTCPRGQECRSGTCVYATPGEGEPCSGLCAAGLQCLGSSAADAKCYRQCNPTSGAGCTADYTCQGFGGSVGYCLPAGTLSEGQACQEAGSCAAGLVCVPNGAGAAGGTCRRQCATNGSIPCPAGKTCVDVAGGGAACFDDAQTVGFCEACSSASPCSSGLTCRYGAGGTLCRQVCTADAECGPGRDCIQDGSLKYCTCQVIPDPEPVKRGEGESCAAESECDAGMTCIIDPQPVCRVTCTDDAVCGTGRTCQTLGAARICRTAVVQPPVPASSCGCAAGGPVELLAGLGLLAGLRRRRAGGGRSSRA